MVGSGSMRLRSVQRAIIPLVDQMIQQCPGTISFGQGVVHYGPPDQAKKRLQDFLVRCNLPPIWADTWDVVAESIHTAKARKGESDRSYR